MVFPTAFIMNESPTVCKEQAMDMYLSGYEGSSGSPREDHLSLFQPSPTRVFARSSRTFSRRSSTGGIFSFTADLQSSKKCFHASVSTVAETVTESEPPSHENATSCNHPVKFHAHRAFRRSSMPCSNSAFEPLHSAENGTPNMTLRDDMDGKLDRAGPTIAADARCADKSPPSSECWMQQIKKLREKSSMDKKASLLFRGEDALRSLPFSNMLEKNQAEPQSKNLLAHQDHRNCSTEHVISKQILKITASEATSAALGVSLDKAKSPKANSSSFPGVTTALTHNDTEPIEEMAPHPTLRDNRKVQDIKGSNLPVQHAKPLLCISVSQDRQDDSSEHSDIDYHPAEYARQLLGLQARPNMQKEGLYERAAHPTTRVEGEEEDVSWTSNGLDDELSEVTVSSFEYERESGRRRLPKESMGIATPPEDGASLRCREEVNKLLSQILLEEQTLQRDALSPAQVRALRSLPTENMEAILRYMEICRYENVATRWDIVAVMIGNIEQEAEDSEDEESLASSDFGFMGRSCEDDMCSIGSGFSLDASIMECDSSISCSDHDDITCDSEYEEEEVVEEETVVSASEDFQESCQI